MNNVAFYFLSFDIIVRRMANDASRKDIELIESSSLDQNKTSDSHNQLEPTEHELATLEHVSDRIPLAAWLIIVCEFCERFAFFGLTGPFQNYIQFPAPGSNETQPGALNRGQQTATSLTTFFQFLCYLTPIFGAILADQIYGKYRTIFISCIIYGVGLAILVLTSINISIDNGVAFPGLIIGMIVIGFGTGGVKSNVSPLMGEQYTRNKPIVKGMSYIILYLIDNDTIVHILHSCCSD